MECFQYHIFENAVSSKQVSVFELGFQFQTPQNKGQHFKRMFLVSDVLVTFNLTCVHIIFSSDWVAEWPPFGK